MDRGLPTGRFRIGDWMIDPSIDEIATGSRTHKLEPRTMRVLVRLAQAGGEVVSGEQLLEEVWAGVVVGPASVYQSVSHLRKVLGDSDASPRYIATVPRKGYRLVAPVEWLSTPAAPGAATIGPALTPTAPVAAPAVALDDTGSFARRRGDHPARRQADLRRARLRRAALVAVLGATIAALAWWLWPRAQSPTIAVLPFVDMSAEGGQQTFCDGLADEVSIWLAQVPEVRVVARTSAFAFRGRNEDVRRIGRELSASHLLEGTVRRSRDRVRVTAQLVDTRTGYEVWSQSIDRPFVDVISIQDDIARAVGTALELRLSPAFARRLGARNPANARAYERYLLAREAWRRRTADDNARAMVLYDEAIALDPKFALAYAGKAMARLNDIYLSAAPRTVAANDAGVFAARALELAPDLPEALAARAAVRNEEGRYDAAIADLDRALAANPNSVDARAERARNYRTLGRPLDALPDLERAAVLDPLDFARHADLCSDLRDLGRYDAARTACLKARSLEPNGPWALLEMAYLEYAQGRLAEAWHWLQLGSVDRGNDALLADLRAKVLGMVGLPGRARALLEGMRATSSDPERTELGIAAATYLEQGPGALRDYLARTTLAQSSRAEVLLTLAQFALLGGDQGRAAAFVDRALAAPDFSAAMLTGPDYLRWATSGGPVVAWVEANRGQAVRARQLRATLLAAVARMEANGEAGFGLRVVRAEVEALEGKPEAAVASLAVAVDRGWRDIVWAESAPHFAALRTHADYRALVERVQRMNDAMRVRIETGSPASGASSGVGLALELVARKARDEPRPRGYSRTDAVDRGEFVGSRDQRGIHLVIDARRDGRIEPVPEDPLEARVEVADQLAHL